MKKQIVIIGAGAIGVAIGASLYEQGYEVCFTARERTREAINQGGITRTGMFGEIKVPAGEVRAVSSLGELERESVDFVLVCTKTLANEDAAAALDTYRNVLKPECRIVILQNGWGNDEPFLKYFTKEQVWRARVITGFARTAPNCSTITVHTAPILFGSLYGYDPACLKELADAINASGIPSDTTEEVSEALWAKMLYNTTLNPLGAILKVPYGSLGEVPATRDIMNRLIHETFTVMDACGYKSFWKTPEEYIEAFYSKLLPDTYAHRSSTLQDMEKHLPTEIHTLNGCIVRLAKEHGLEVPTHQMLCELILFLEAQY